jgi:hypothetical protein
VIPAFHRHRRSTEKLLQLGFAQFVLMHELPLLVIKKNKNSFLLK